MRYDYLIFDLDGTISDPREGIVKSYNYAFRSLGYDEADEDILSTYIGDPLDKALSDVASTNDREELDKLVFKYRERYTQKGYAENELYSGIADVLNLLKGKGFNLGVCTSKRIDYASAIIELFGIGELFDFISGGDIGIKKSRQLSDLLSEGKITKNSIMIGDRYVDMIAARDNDLAVAGVLWGYGSHEELSEHKPDYLFKTPSDMAEAFLRY